MQIMIKWEVKNQKAGPTKWNPAKSHPSRGRREFNRVFRRLARDDEGTFSQLNGIQSFVKRKSPRSFLLR